MSKTDQTAAVQAVLREAVRFACWAAGEGLCPVEGENAAAPEDFLFAYSQATGDEDCETLHERIGQLLSPPLSVSPSLEVER